jgi:hypothetical protein
MADALAENRFANQERDWQKRSHALRALSNREGPYSMNKAFVF